MLLSIGHRQLRCLHMRPSSFIEWTRSEKCFFNPVAVPISEPTFPMEHESSIRLVVRGASGKRYQRTRRSNSVLRGTTGNRLFWKYGLERLFCGLTDTALGGS